jgi:hypothetical protein
MRSLTIGTDTVILGIVTPYRIFRNLFTPVYHNFLSPLPNIENIEKPFARMNVRCETEGRGKETAIL